MRFDLGGIGDSEPAPGAEANVAYPERMLDDASEAITFVRGESPHRQVIVAGLCSGGWLAYLAAREGLPVDGIVSINPPLYLRDAAAATQWLWDADALGRYRQSMRDPAKWIKALRGRASYARFARVALFALRRQLAVRGVLGEAIPNGLAKDLRAIAERRIRSLFIFSSGDYGLAYFEHAASTLRRAEVREFVRYVVVDGAGHTFRPRAAQATLRELLSDFAASERVP
jgi:pimeloyl-ACP methyl ester carboxylesterase